MMNYFKKIGLIIFLLNYAILSNAQITTYTQTFGSSNVERIGGLQTNIEMETFVIGTFGDDFNIGNKTLLVNGIEDIYMAKNNANGETVWAKSIGSNDREKVTGFRLFEDTVLYFSGVFWDNISFDNINLSANGNALFVAKYDTSGNAIWANAIYGNGLKFMNEGVTDAQGNYIVTGSFSNELYFPNDTLISQGSQDAFVAKYDKNGNFLWANRVGFQQRTIATGLTVNDLGEIYMAGQFDGRVIFGNDTLWAAALDFDIFFAQYNANGNLQFGKRFGGIYDNTNPKLAMGIFGKVVMAGTFVGLLNFDQLSIQTNNFDSDMFLATFSSSGDALEARGFGGSNHEVLEGLAVNIDDYYLSGYFTTSTQIDNISVTTAFANVQNIVIRTSNIFMQLQPTVISYPTVQPSSTLFVVPYFNTSNSEIAMAGTFQGTINLPLTTPSPVSNGFTDVFLVGSTLPPVRTSDIKNEVNLTIFPNPASDFINLDFQLFIPKEAIKIEIINTFGQVQKEVFINKNNTNQIHQIDVSNLSKGIYIVRFVGYPETQKKLDCLLMKL